MSEPKIFAWLLNDKYFLGHTEFTGRKGESIAGYVVQKCFKDKETGKTLYAKGCIWMKDMQSVREVRDALDKLIKGEFELAEEPSAEQNNR